MTRANSPAEKLILIGLDGMSMELALKMCREGRMPNLARLIDDGVYSHMLGVHPTLTPPGWTSLATGAWPGTHEVTDFYIRDPGSSLSRTRFGVNSELCKAEFIWNAAERAGKFPILLKWEMSWPPRMTKGIQVEGGGPAATNYHAIASYHLFTLDDLPLVTRVRLQPADGWSNAPDSAEPPKETELAFTYFRHGHLDRAGVPARETGATVPTVLNALVIASGDRGYDRVIVSRTKDASNPVADLGLREWSDWFEGDFQVKGETVTGTLRLKLLKLSPRADEFELFCPQIWPVEGYTYPEPAARELLENVGPFIQDPGYMALVVGVIDDETYLELMEYHHQWLGRAAGYLSSAYDWGLMLVQVHTPDYFGHSFFNKADPIGGSTGEELERGQRAVYETCESVDRMIGVLVEVGGPDTVVAICADHGGTADPETRVVVEEVLAQYGLLRFVEDERTGLKSIDYTSSKAVPVGQVNVFVNLEGREPDGIVPQAEYEQVRLQIMDALMDFKDEATGRRPFSLVLKREDAEIVGLKGELVGDVVFALHPEFDHVHGKQLPSARLGWGGQHSVFVMAGPGVRRGVELKSITRHVDVAPTCAHLIGIPPPADCEGAVIYEALEEPDWYLKRIRQLERERDRWKAAYEADHGLLHTR